jgi:Trp operon repressor
MEENLLALEVWNSIQAVGSEMTMRLMNLTLSPAEAEDLLYKLKIISSTIMRAQREKEEQQ